MKYLLQMICVALPAIVLGVLWGSIGVVVGAAWGVFSAFAGGEVSLGWAAIIGLPALLTMPWPVFLATAIILAALGAVSYRQLLNE